MPPAPPPPPGQTFPYDHLFKLLMIGDAGVGKVSQIKAVAS
jgi:GTPase SAR1 family protein